MAREQATHEKVRDTYYALVAQNEKPTIRNIQNRIGGSYTTITKHVSTIKERERRDKIQHFPISDRVTEALRDELHAVAEQTKEALFDERRALVEREEELLMLMTELERQVGDRAVKIESLQNRLAGVESDNRLLTEQLDACRTEKRRTEQELLAKAAEIGQLTQSIQQRSINKETPRRKRKQCGSMTHQRYGASKGHRSRLLRATYRGRVSKNRNGA